MVESTSFVDRLENSRRYLTKIAMGMVGDRDLAEDLVQDTFMRGWVSRDKFRAGARLETWLVAIMRNRYVDIMRGSYFQRTTVVDTTQLDLPVFDNERIPVTEGEILASLDDRLLRALKMMGPDRTAFMMSALDGFTHKQIAARTDVSSKCICNRLKKARDLARTCYVNSEDR